MTKHLTFNDIVKAMEHFKQHSREDPNLTILVNHENYKCALAAVEDGATEAEAQAVAMGMPWEVVKNRYKP